MHEHRVLQKDDFVRMNLPSSLWRASPKQIPESVATPIERYVVDIDASMKKGLGLILWGEPGVGKTGTAAVIAREARSHGHTVFFVTIEDLRVLLQSNVRFDAENSVWDRCRSVDLLILDGLEVEDAATTITRAPKLKTSLDSGPLVLNAAGLTALVSHRASWTRSTILTTRMSLRGKASLEETFSGLLEVSRACCVFLRVEGPNKRQGVQAELQKLLGIEKKLLKA